VGVECRLCKGQGFGHRRHGRLRIAEQPERPGQKRPDGYCGFPGDGRGDGTFNTPPVIEAADTPPFFHNNAVATLEEAVAFYTTDTFNDSPPVNRRAFVLDQDEINANFVRSHGALRSKRFLANGMRC
jgi:cytochrome c peroxidase